MSPPLFDHQQALPIDDFDANRADRNSGAGAAGTVVASAADTGDSIGIKNPIAVVTATRAARMAIFHSLMAPQFYNADREMVRYTCL